MEKKGLRLVGKRLTVRAGPRPPSNFYGYSIFNGAISFEIHDGVGGCVRYVDCEKRRRRKVCAVYKMTYGKLWNSINVRRREIRAGNFRGFVGGPPGINVKNGKVARGKFASSFCSAKSSL